jgi:hypothetical protein
MMPSIKVSQDLYLALDRLRDPKDKRMTDVLWRLVEERGIKRTEPTSTERGWWYTGDASEGVTASDVTIPNDAVLRCRYKGKSFQAKVEGGKIVFDGSSYDTPSAAARAVLAKNRISGGAANVNGWRFWEMEYPAASGQWRRLDSFRKPWQVKRHRS